MTRGARRRPAGAGGHPLPQRLRAGRGQFAGRRRCRGRPSAGHDQRLRRALRQRRPDFGRRQPGVEEARATKCSSPESIARLTELSRFVYETANMNFRAQPAVRRHERLRPQGRDARQRHRPGHVELRAHRPAAWWATSGACWSASCRAGRTSWPWPSKHNITDDPRADGQDPGPGGRPWRMPATSSRRPRARSTCWSRSAPAPSGRTSSG